VVSQLYTAGGESDSKVLTNPSNLIHLFLSVIKGFIGKEKHMYFLQDKSQLHSFVNSIREQLLELEPFGLSPKPAKLKEIVSRCLGFNSYADAISKLPIDIEEVGYDFPKAMSETLISQPYGLAVDEQTIGTIFNTAVETYAYFDEEMERMSIIMASESC